MQLRRIFSIAFLSVIVTGCVSVQTTQPGAIGLDRKQRMSPLVSEQELRQGSAAAYAQVIGQARQKGSLNTNAALTRRVRLVADRLIPQSAVFRQDAVNWDWQVNVINSPELNAWAMPGGKIAFYSGIIEKLKLSDAEIAAIMGHEISHALREHSRERMSEQTNKGLLLELLGAATGAGQSAKALADLAYQATVGLPNSRLHETESDRMGIELMARAGYDPRAAVSVWQKMAKLSQGGGPEFLSTHPSHATRIQDLTSYAQRVMPLYQRASNS
ncbi:MAG: M48 family metallopeptidase [Granulosicoccus sp.]